MTNTLLNCFMSLNIPLKDGESLMMKARLIMSDGSATLYFLDPINFTKVDQIEVYDEEPVTQLNELEYIQGKIYANVWNEDKIAIINPQTGKVTGWINLGRYLQLNQSIYRKCT